MEQIKTVLLLTKNGLFYSINKKGYFFRLIFAKEEAQ